ncbi:hypothetical protein TRICI_006684 [Trichomonascus ciferrii]|uniref:Condensin complex subunit 2 n=1 Tax=Trichomonascus ciferrii TaxID=44093 RepID=A0A642UEV3_9ASCO|nr:hypothetical protein TRICI_006684 [Trichomonascus ciferrii]
MARPSGELTHTTRRKSSKLRESDASQSLIQLNDDALEKESRRSSNITDSKRQSIATVARETIRNSSKTINANTSREKEAPILANFEQWMKLVKDNKINATNSWNFALIDYFHDMSLLKEGDGINFQKASYTLDGCVKIYTSRVDSVASETGKLLSGLADSDKKKGNGKDEGDDVMNEGDSDGEEDGKEKQKKKRRAPKAESTLVKNEEQLQAKKLDLELSIDPLFRKMCADFDEGGAKGLLLNSLVIDKDGRVVFDGEVDYDSDEEEYEEQEGSSENNDEEGNGGYAAVDFGQLRTKYLPDLSELESLEVCPSLKHLNSALTDPALFSSSIMKEVEENKQDTDRNINGHNDDSGNFVMDADDIDDGINFDPGNDDEDMGFGGIDDGPPLLAGDGEDVPMPADDGGNNDTSAHYGTTATGMNTTMVPSKDLMSYFDETLKKNWAGPQHWKIQKIRAGSLLEDTTFTETNTTSRKKQPAKEKEPFYIDFLSDDHEVDESVIFAEGGTSINIPRTQWKSKGKHLLPDDKHFTSKNLVKLFLKPKGTIRNSKIFGSQEPLQGDVDADEHFWANHYQQAINSDDQVEGNYDANFFQGDDDEGALPLADFGDDDYDAPPSDVPSSDLPTNGGDLKDQLLMASRRARPEYVNYAKSAKKVNIKLLKDNIWNVMKMEDTLQQPEEEQEQEPAKQPPAQQEETCEFKEIVQDLKSVYPPQQMSEISTSFCFICVLHLANEKGLTIEGTPNYDNLYIHKDPSAVISDSF